MFAASIFHWPIRDHSLFWVNENETQAHNYCATIGLSQRSLSTLFKERLYAKLIFLCDYIKPKSLSKSNTLPFVRVLCGGENWREESRRPKKKIAELTEPNESASALGSLRSPILFCFLRSLAWLAALFSRPRSLFTWLRFQREGYKKAIGNGLIDSRSKIASVVNRKTKLLWKRELMYSKCLKLSRLLWEESAPTEDIWRRTCKYVDIVRKL